MLTIEMRINGRVIAFADIGNISDLADVSDYTVRWMEYNPFDKSSTHDAFVIKGHDRNTSVFSLVSKVAQRVLEQKAGVKI